MTKDGSTTVRRRDMRVLALSALYNLESWGDGDPRDIFQNVADSFFPNLWNDGKGAAIRFPKALFDAASHHLQDIDALISSASEGWPIQRMPRVDLAIVRLAIAEMLYVKETPREVSIDEALELCKDYSTHASSKFVNGVLMGILREL